MSTFVLIHGSWHGGWCWRDVAAKLREAGHVVFCPTLTGLGERSHLGTSTTNLLTHINDVLGVLKFEDITQGVLVGHSYAGLVLAGVAEIAPTRIKRLIYFDALIASPGQSWFDLQEQETAINERRKMMANHGFRVPPPSHIFGISDPQMAAWVQERLVPQPIATYEQPVPKQSDEGRNVPRSYIFCTEGITSTTFAKFAHQAQLAGWPVRQLHAGHDAMLTAPQDAAKTIMDLAEGL